MTGIRRVAVVVPAHDEELLVGRCLRSVTTAAAAVDVPVTVVVVLDACTDGTADLLPSGVRPVVGGWRVVGAARAAGFDAIRDDDPAAVWVACTDADSAVGPDWLSRQLAAAADGADAVCGRVTVDDWTGHAQGVRGAFGAAYGEEVDPVHGACLGVRLSAYDRVGGFRPLPVGEDRDLVARLAADPAARVVHDRALVVTTSGRPRSRVVGGFAGFLGALTS